MVRELQPLALRTDQVGEDALPSCRLPEYGHPGRVTAELSDITLDPLHSSNLIEKPVISRAVMRGLVIELGMGEESESAKPVISRDYDDTFFSKSGSVIQWFRPGSLSECSAMDEEHDRQFIVSTLCRCPDVEVQAVFAHICRNFS